MSFSFKGSMIVSAIYGMLAVIFAFLPLTNLLGYEFSFGLGIAVSFCGGILAVLATQKRSHPSPTRLTIGVTLWNLLLLFPPFLIILLNALRVKNCNLLEGMAFFLLLPGVTACLASCVGVCVGYLVPRRKWAILGYVLLVLFSILSDAVHMLFDPPVFAYNPFLGYFPGPIYDEALSWHPTLLLYRLLVLVASCWFFALIHFMAKNERIEWNTFPVTQPIDAYSRKIWHLFYVSSILLICATIARGPLGFHISRSFLQGALAGRIETEHFVIHYDQSLNADEIRKLALDHEFRFVQLIRFLELTTPISKKFHSYVYKNGEQKKRLMGAKNTMIGDPFDGELHINYRSAPHPVLKHELCHLVSGLFGPKFFKVNLNIGLAEGLCVAADWQGDRYTPHTWSAAMRKIGKAPSLEKTLSLRGFWQQASSQAYTLCGSFSRFLMDRYGVESFKTLYSGASFEKVYHKTPEELAQLWASFIDQIPLDPSVMLEAKMRFSRESIFQKTCAHEIATLNQKAQRDQARNNDLAAIQSYETILEYMDRDDTALSALISLYLKRNNLDEAARYADALLKSQNPSHQIFAKEKLAHIAWERNDFSQAYRIYEEIWAAQFSDSSNLIAQTALSLLTDQTLRNHVLPRMLPPINHQKALQNLLSLTGDPKTQGLVSCLIAQSFKPNELHQSLPFFDVCLERLALSPEFSKLQKNLAWQYAKTYFVLEDFFRAEAQWREMFQFELTEGEKVDVNDWLERCRWMQTSEPF